MRSDARERIANHVGSRLVNIAIGVVMVLGGISQFFPISMSSVIVGCYVMAFGVGKLAMIPAR